MSISEKLSDQQFKELLEDIYMKGQESEFIQAEDILKDIENKLMTLLAMSN
ncbi:hypothetical protein [Lederbergia citrea]|uniref:Uncharacterized protein n=1 Tax=Lederbergia citrea TaxID=2833581 RepID=A0A942UNS4_9BACI|nr:hypothetical protein [Lederbergia citrea]MBS4205812.1 hypothetical protein [Lederbergia citrea]MBS4224740.1 hypothetical protein [Lederbergia citrea]